MVAEVQNWLKKTPGSALLNAGELSDALATDHITGLSKALVPSFRTQDRHKLLFLTKSTNIGHLLAMEPTPQVIVSFSINAPEVSNMFEPAAPGPLKRLVAVKVLLERGWKIRLRIDPMVPIEDWKEAYGRLATALHPVDTITLGTLRYFRALPNYSHRGKDIFKYASVKDGADNRFRVEKDLRLEMYRFMLQELSGVTSKIGLCKETREMHELLGLPGEAQSCNCTVH